MSTAPAASQRAATVATVFHAEWTKLRTLRSTWITAGGAVVASIALAALLCASQASQWDTMSEHQRQTFDATSTALIGVLFSSVILGSLAVRAVTAEYATGMIRVTFAAMPRRRSVLVAKALILTVAVLPVTLVANLASFLLGQQLLSSTHAKVSLSDPGVTKAVLLGTLAVSVVMLLGLGLGGLMRRTAPATTALSVALAGSQVIGIALPNTARQYLPGSLLQAVVTIKPDPGLLDPSDALLVLTILAAVVFELMVKITERRDA